MKKYVVLSLVLIELFFSSVYAKSCVVFFSLDTLDLGAVDASTAATRPDFNTHTVAQYVAEKTKSDLLRIETMETYPNKINAAINVFQEQLSGARAVSIKADKDNLDSYDQIYLGYPVWLNGMPNEIVAYLKMHEKELAGKRISIFSTTGGSPNSQSVTEIKNQFQQIVFGSAVSISMMQKDNYKTLIDEWLGKNS